MFAWEILAVASLMLYPWVCCRVPLTGRSSIDKQAICNRLCEVSGTEILCPFLVCVNSNEYNKTDCIDDRTRINMNYLQPCKPA